MDPKFSTHDAFTANSIKSTFKLQQVTARTKIWLNISNKERGHYYELLSNKDLAVGTAEVNKGHGHYLRFYSIYE